MNRFLECVYSDGLVEQKSMYKAMEIVLCVSLALVGICPCDWVSSCIKPYLNELYCISNYKGRR